MLLSAAMFETEWAPERVAERRDPDGDLWEAVVTGKT